MSDREDDALSFDNNALLGVLGNNQFNREQDKNLSEIEKLKKYIKECEESIRRASEIDDGPAETHYSILKREAEEKLEKLEGTSKSASAEPERG